MLHGAYSAPTGSHTCGEYECVHSAHIWRGLLNAYVYGAHTTHTIINTCSKHRCVLGTIRTYTVPTTSAHTHAPPSPRIHQFTHGGKWQCLYIVCIRRRQCAYPSRAYSACNVSRSHTHTACDSSAYTAVAQMQCTQQTATTNTSSRIQRIHQLHTYGKNNSTRVRCTDTTRMYRIHLCTETESDTAYNARGPTWVQTARTHVNPAHIPHVGHEHTANRGSWMCCNFNPFVMLTLQLLQACRRHTPILAAGYFSITVDRCFCTDGIPQLTSYPVSLIPFSFFYIARTIPTIFREVKLPFFFSIRYLFLGDSWS